tara:strand:- start:357 stop:662 length:306 start_codon:yes stop_codon:yes gene_type:complete
MRKFKILFLFLFFISCSGFQEAGKVLRNEKVKTNDEFLVKKREPLITPPDYNKIPKPGSIEESKNNEEDEQKLKKILKSTEEVNQDSSNSTEESIIDKIRR